MPVISRLPGRLENVQDLLLRRKRAAETREQWRSTYRDCFRFAMPTRETFSWHTPGQDKNSILYDSTLQENTYEAANTLCATLFPTWTHWADLAPGGAIPAERVDKEILAGLQKATTTFFDFLNQSNFATVINETALDLMVGTGALDFEEGETNEQPFVFNAIPLSVLELEEGPLGTIETTFMERKPKLGHLLRMYRDMLLSDLPIDLQKAYLDEPQKEITVIQMDTYSPETKHYYGVVIYGTDIIWRYDYGITCPRIVARATKVAGETYGRGRALLALSDARTLDKMVELTLRQGVLNVAPPWTGVSDGVMNPYTTVVTPNVIIPVASNDSGNPSLAPLEVGGNFNITQEMMRELREKIRRTMLGPEMSQGPIKTATEITLADRNRLWAMNGEYSRVQAELLAKIVIRGVDILQRRGLIPKFKIDGRLVKVRYVSPFSKSQNQSDIQALQETLTFAAALGPQIVNMGLKTEDIPKWVAKKSGLDLDLVRSDEERQQLTEQAAQLTAAAAENPDMAANAMEAAT